MKSSKFNIWLITVLGALLLLTISMQVYTIEKQTKMEGVLFNILQFIFSLGFSWVLSRVTANEEFIKSQKKFAISAYRRIKEIEKGVENLISRTSTKKNAEFVGAVTNDSEVTLAIAISIRESIKSSIADWSDIIGDEITTVEEIERIKNEGSISLRKKGEVRGGTQDESTSDELKEDQIEKLLSMLPASLRVYSDNSSGNEFVKSVNRSLVGKLNKFGVLALRCFWDETFERDIFELNEGEELFVEIDDAGERKGIFVVKDRDGNSVGMIMNTYYHDYNQFMTNVIDNVIRKSKFIVQLEDIDREVTDGESRHVFTVVYRL